MQKRKSGRDLDMTQGVIWKQLLIFALPLMVGNIFQQLYNTVDSIVVGNFVGKEALAAVGSVSPIITSLIGFFIGLSAGAGVVISQAYGAKDDERVSKAVHTTMTLTFLLCIVFSVLGVVITPVMLRLMGTPADVFPQAEQYLDIYFAGAAGLLIYNMGAGILRAVGDSRRPLYFLIFSASVNTVLDILLVAVFKMGIAGATWATVISQVLSAILVLIVLARTEGAYCLQMRKMGINWEILRSIIQIGFPAALQAVVTSVSNVIVQSYINAFGSSVMAGWGAYIKLDQFIILPVQSLSLAATTFVGQNYGARKEERIRKGTNCSLGLSELITAAIMIPVMIFAPFLVELFNRDPEVIACGTMLLRMMVPWYLICCINQIYASALRGLGNSRTPMFIMIGSFVVFRQIYLYVVSAMGASLRVVAFGYPAGWILCSVVIILYYRWYWRQKN